MQSTDAIARLGGSLLCVGCMQFKMLKQSVCYDIARKLTNQHKAALATMLVHAAQASNLLCAQQQHIQDVLVRATLCAWHSQLSLG